MVSFPSLWNSRVERKLRIGATSLQAGRLGTLQVRASEIILGEPLIINKANIDQMDF